MTARSWLPIAVALALTGSPYVAIADESGGYAREETSNWGRWGDDDERGAANLITPEALVAAGKLIRKGATFSLAIPLDETGPVFPGRTNPHHTMAITGVDHAAGAESPMAIGDLTFADDYIYMPLQGSTQWDALSHAWYGGTLYNDVPETAIRSAPLAGGATKLGIENVKSSLIGRGVLIDVPRHKGGRLPAGTAITPADLDAALAAQGSEVRPGDIVVVRTGWVPGWYELADPVERARYLVSPQTGVHPDVVAWAKEKEIAAMAADNLALEVVPSPKDAGPPFQAHAVLLRDLGVYIGEIWWLEELAADCADDGRYEFFLSAAPLNITGAVGSPVNPVAIK